MTRNDFPSGAAAETVLTNLLTDVDVTPAELRAAAARARRTPIGGHGLADRVTKRTNDALAVADELEAAGQDDEGEELWSILTRRELLDDRIAFERMRADVMLDAIRELDPERAAATERAEAEAPAATLRNRPTAERLDALVEDGAVIAYRRLTADADTFVVAINAGAGGYFTARADLSTGAVDDVRDLEGSSNAALAEAVEQHAAELVLELRGRPRQAGGSPELD